MIQEFKGHYRFLSNFYPCDVVYEGQPYNSSEHAYMAAKTTDPSLRKAIAACPTPAEAKKMGRKIQLRPDWESIKLGVMEEILMDKFTRNPNLKQALLATGDNELVEGNWWNDKIWGYCLKTNQGQNLLGRTLMKIRTALKGAQLPLITIVNKHHGATGEYIGRGSPLGNPFPIEGRNTRDVVIEKYEVWLKDKIDSNDPVVCDELNRLANIAYDTGRLKLQCFCTPHACHGDVIREVLLEAFKGDTNA